MKKHVLPVVILSIALLQTATGAFIPIFTDDFESGTLANWTTTAGAPLEPSTAQNIVPPPPIGRFSAFLNVSTDRMHHNIIGDNGGAEVGGPLMLSYWIFDDGSTTQSTGSTRVYKELRGYSGGIGLPNGGTVASGTLALLLAAGKFNQTTLPGEVFSATKYQARVAFGPGTGGSTGWFNLNDAGSPNRSVGWHRFDIEVMLGGSVVRFYVDGILSRTFSGAAVGTYDTLMLGPGLGIQQGNAWFDGVVLSVFDNPPQINCPSNQTVTATSPNGAPVNYPPPTASDDGGPPTVTCNPPSGSNFPIGTTQVECIARDSRGQTNSCTFLVIVRLPSAQVQENLYLTDSFPPIGSYNSPAAEITRFANGIIARWYIHQIPWPGCPQCPPPPCLTCPPVIYDFLTDLDFQISTDDGLKWQDVSTRAMTSVRVAVGDVTGDGRSYDMEMVRLELQGGGLPPGAMLRESPTRASTGKTSVRQIEGGFMIGSFFDVWTELSLDGGQTWSSVINPSHVELTSAPAEQFYITDSFPPVGSYDSLPTVPTRFDNGLIARWYIHQIPPFPPFPPIPPPCLTCPPEIYEIPTVLDFEFSTDGGQDWRKMRVNVDTVVQMTPTMGSTDTRLFDGEILDLRMENSALGVMLRESPTLRSTGQTTVRRVDGGFRIGSFFDIYTEVSLDGGQNWSKVVNPSHVELRATPTEQFYATDTFPPVGTYNSLSTVPTIFNNGIIARWYIHRIPPIPIPIPPVCLTCPPDILDFRTILDFQVSLDQGESFRQFSVPVDIKVSVDQIMTSGDTRLFETELLSMDLTGGQLGTVMLRESPTLRSMGKTSLRSIEGGYMMGSFFDVWTELSLDGGQTWSGVRDASHVELLATPPPVLRPTDAFPPIGSYNSLLNVPTIFDNGIIARRYIHQIIPPLPPQPPTPCLFCPPEIFRFPSRLSFDVSTDGGLTFSPVTANVDVTAQAMQTMVGEDLRIFETEILALDLVGTGSPIMLRESPSRRSLGVTYVQDAPGGVGFQISSYFDIYTEISLDDGRTWAGVKNPSHVELTDLPEIDHFSNSVAHITLCRPGAPDEDITAAGPTTVHVYVGEQGQAGDTDGDGRDQVRTEMVQLDLSGPSSMGPVSIRLRPQSKHPFRRSEGQIEELANTLPGRLDVPPFAPAGLALSEFDLYLEVTIQTPNGPLVLHNDRAKRMRAVIDHKPPGQGTTYEFPDIIELLTENEQPTGIVICRSRHIPVPPEPEIDHFSNSVAQITLCRPDGTEVEDLELDGPTTVHVFIGPQGQADDSDGDGLDDSRTEMVLMNLTGSSSMGPVTMRLRDISKHPFQSSGGSIEELANTQAGRLDLPPFAPAGQAVSEFEVYVEIEIQTPNGPLILHNDRPKRMRAIIDHKPPGPGTTYEFPEIIPLLREDETPSGLVICKSKHITQCRISIACSNDIVVCNDPNACGAKVDYPPPFVNATCPPVNVVCVPPSGSFFNVGVTPVTCTARDSRGNQASCTFRVIVRDCEPPRLVCPPNGIVVSNDANRCSAIVNYPLPPVTDNCPGATVACVPPPGTVFPVGATPVTCTATDAAGNTNTCTFPVIVRDTEPPRIVCPSNIVVRTCERRAIVTYTPTANDNCPGVTVLCNPPSGTVFPTGTHPVTCHAIDSAGNTSPDCTFTVTVITAPAPTLTITKLANGQIMICWETDCPGWRLQCTRSLNPPIMWQPVTEPVVTTGSRHCVTLDAVGAHQFYRLCRPEAQEIYAETDNFPPQGAYMSPGDEISVILLPAPGGALRPIQLRWFVHQIPPDFIPRPPPCLTCPPETFQFGGDLQFQVSMDGGQSWGDVHPEPKLTAIQVRGDPDPQPNVRAYLMEMLRLDGAGNIGGVQFMIRESPTRASTGRTTIREAADGTFLIDSFFDVWIELSLNGGQTWAGVQSGIPMVLNSRPPQQFSATGKFPPVGTYNSPRKQLTRFANGLIARWYAHPIPPIEIPIPIPIPIPWPDPCLSCPPFDFKFATDLMFEVSPDGGQTWIDVGGLSDVGVRVKQTRQLGDTGFFDMEMTQLEASGELGGLQQQGPAGAARWMLRESPTLASKGKTTLRKVADGTYRLGSFFDIYTEVSMDGGQTWHRSLEPSHVEYIATPPAQYAATAALPPAGSFDSPAAQITDFGDIIARWYVHPIPPPICPPFCPIPGPCLTCPPDPFQFETDIHFQVSLDRGQNWMDVSAPSFTRGIIAPRTKIGGLSSFDTEILQLDVRGGLGTAQFMLRESPTRRSVGYTQVEAIPDGTSQISSFFDIWTELSLDGGQTWMASKEPTHVTHRAAASEQFSATGTFPPVGTYNSPRAQITRFANGLVARWYAHPIPPIIVDPPFPPWPDPCLSCPPFDFKFVTDLLFEVSADGGQTWRDVGGLSDVGVRVMQTRQLGNTGFFDMEMTGLNASGELGGLQQQGPDGAAPRWMLRESPSRPSKGTTLVRKASDGTYRLGSFFDIYTEVSLDGGQSWHRSLTPSHVEYVAAPPPQYAESPALPPQGTYIGSPAQLTEFANGIIARWYVHRIPPLVCPPFCPRPGPCDFCPPDPWEFDTDIQFQVSMDGGQSWIDINASSKVGGMIAPLIKAGNMQAFDVEMQQLDVRGQTPSGAPFMLRESPTRRSQGYTEVHTESDGTYRVSSFFDIWTDLSLDGGQTWFASKQPTHVAHSAAPPEQWEDTASLPPAGTYNSPSLQETIFANGIIARWYAHPIPPAPCPPIPCLTCPPVPCGFITDIFFQWSLDGGQSWNAANAKSENRILVDQTMALGTAGPDPTPWRFVETEMIQLDISGGNLPPGVMIRESPSRRSLGMTTQRQVSGGFRVSSFFDIHTEISLNGGQSWSPSRKPSHVALVAQPPPVAERNDLFPPEGSYNGVIAQGTHFANGIIARRYQHPIQIPPIIPEPAPCLSCPPELYEFPQELIFEFSVDGGQTWQQARAASLVNVQVRAAGMAGGTRLYDAEMLRLDAQASLPGLPMMMLRESPSRRSLGHTSVGDSPNLSRPFDVSSFFDIWAEMSLDGGQTWAPSLEATHVILQPTQ